MATTSKRSSHSKGLILLLFTSGFFLSGLIFDYMPIIIDSQIKRTVELATNKEIQSIWSKPPVDFHSFYWLYDVENVNKFMLGEEKIKVRRVGPYGFTSRIEKNITNISQNKYRITYNSTRHIYLNESASINLDEPLVLLNPVYASLIAASREMARNMEPQARQMMLISAARLADRFNETLFINTTARSALIGRRLLMMEKAKKMAETFGFNIKLPASLAESNNFGYISILNGTWDGPFEIYSGYQVSQSSLGDVISYKGKKRLTEFQGKCNRLQTSAGELRPMPIEINTTLEMFQPAFCRIIHLNPIGTKRLNEGETILYEIAESDFLSAEHNPDNRCFCLNDTINNYCSLNGAIELGPCTLYSPIVATISNIKVDERISNSILDWDPDMLKGDVEFLPKPDDRAQIIIVKRLGVPLQGDITITLFIKLIRDPAFRQTSLVPEETFIPIITVRERAKIPPKLGQIIVNLESFLSLTNHLKVVMYLTAIVLLCSLTGHYYSKSSANDQVGPSANNNNNNNNNNNRDANSENRRNSSMIGRMSNSTALPASVATSDRANSADSNRSQPPSRVSHSSLDNVSANSTNPDDNKINQNDIETGTNQDREINSTDQLISLANDSKQVKFGYRNFSKVEELRSGAAFEQPMANGSSSGVKHKPEVDVSTEALTTIEPRGEEEAAGDKESGRGATTATTTTSKKQRNWFLKVCSNFVRMLTGARRIMNESSHLDVIESDYQDKQLEMLAGKIDSWYKSSPQQEQAKESGQGRELELEHRQEVDKDHDKGPSQSHEAPGNIITSLPSGSSLPAATATADAAVAAAATTSSAAIAIKSNEEQIGANKTIDSSVAGFRARSGSGKGEESRESGDNKVDPSSNRTDEDDLHDIRGPSGDDARAQEAEESGKDQSEGNEATRGAKESDEKSAGVGFLDSASSIEKERKVQGSDQEDKEDNVRAESSSSSSPPSTTTLTIPDEQQQQQQQEKPFETSDENYDSESSKEERRILNLDRQESTQSNKTVINKSDDTSGDESNTSMSTNSALRRNNRRPEVNGDASGAGKTTSSAGGDPDRNTKSDRNEDKAAALESVERALTTNSVINSIEGY